MFKAISIWGARQALRKPLSLGSFDYLCSTYTTKRKNKYVRGTTTIYIKGLPYVANEEQVHNYFKPCGEIKLVKIVAKPDGTSSGCGYVTFAQKDALDPALEMDGSTWPDSDRFLKIETSNANTLNTLGVKPQDCYTVMVGNLPYDVLEEEVKDLFKSSGVISEVRFGKDKITGKSVGYCHIMFKTSTSVDKAIGLDGTLLQGRQLNVDYAVDRYLTKRRLKNRF